LSFNAEDAFGSLVSPSRVVIVRAYLLLFLPELSKIPLVFFFQVFYSDVAVSPSSLVKNGWNFLVK